MFNTRVINLHFPTSWNACSTKELEAIARVFIDRAQAATSFLPFNIEDVKVALFFIFTKLQVVSPVNPRIKVEDQYLVVKQIDERCWLKRLVLSNDKYRPFNLYLWQIKYWIDNGMKWIDDDKTDGLQLFPYKEIKLRGKKFCGPEALMQDFSWHRYRFAQEYMSFYSDMQNHLIYMQKHIRNFSTADIKKQQEHVETAKAMFLATLFNGKVRYVNTDTKRTIYDYCYVSNQHSDNAKYFRSFPDIKFQVVLFWWQGMMKYLQGKYPRCFSDKTPKKKGKKSNPLDFYVRMSATMEKYLGLDEDAVNRQNFHIILQHLEDMARESEELEKIKKK